MCATDIRYSLPTRPLQHHGVGYMQLQGRAMGYRTKEGEGQDKSGRGTGQERKGTKEERRKTE
jgi:hypothetical protein